MSTNAFAEAREGLDDYSARQRGQIYHNLANRMVRGEFLSEQELLLLAYGYTRDSGAHEFLDLNLYELYEALDSQENIRPNSTQVHDLELMIDRGDSITSDEITNGIIGGLAGGAITGAVRGAVGAGPGLLRAMASESGKMSTKGLLKFLGVSGLVGGVLLGNAFSTPEEGSGRDGPVPPPEGQTPGTPNVMGLPPGVNPETALGGIAGYYRNAYGDGGATPPVAGQPLPPIGGSSGQVDVQGRTPEEVARDRQGASGGLTPAQEYQIVTDLRQQGFDEEAIAAALEAARADAQSRSANDFRESLPVWGFAGDAIRIDANTFPGGMTLQGGIPNVAPVFNPALGYFTVGLGQQRSDYGLLPGPPGAESFREEQYGATPFGRTGERVRNVPTFDYDDFSNLIEPVVLPGATINQRVFTPMLGDPHGLTLLQEANLASQRYGVPLGVLYGFINRMSGWQQNTTSSDGSRGGLAQLEVREGGLVYDPRYSINASAALLMVAQRQYGSWEAAMLNMVDPVAAQYYSETGTFLDTGDRDFVLGVIEDASQSSLLYGTQFDATALMNALRRGSGSGRQISPFEAPDPAAVSQFLRGVFDEVYGRKPTDKELSAWGKKIESLYRQAYDEKVKSLQGRESVNIDPEARFREEFEATGEAQFRTESRQTDSVMNFAAGIARMLQMGA